MFANINEKNKRTPMIDVPTALLVGFILTCVGVILLALCLLLFSVSEEMIDGGVLIIYILSCLVAGFVIGKKRKTKRVFWGVFIGVMYYFLLFVATFLVVHSTDTNGYDMVTSLMVCCGSAAFGGMLS